MADYGREAELARTTKWGRGYRDSGTIKHTESVLAKKQNTLAPQRLKDLNPDLQFETTIIDPQNETAQFKTHGRQPILRNVFAAARRTFGIKYERTRLIQCVSTEKGGEIQTDEFDCPAEETSLYGVDGNAKLCVTYVVLV